MEANAPTYITESGKRLNPEWVLHANLEVAQTNEAGDRVVAVRLKNGELAIHEEHSQEVNQDLREEFAG